MSMRGYQCDVLISMFSVAGPAKIAMRADKEEAGDRANEAVANHIFVGF